MILSPINLVLVACMISLSVSANVLIKIGVSRTPQLSSNLFNQLNLLVISGLGLFGLTFIVYSLLLKRMPLNVAQCFMSGQFIAVILASYFLLGESITWQKAVGIVLIAVGIVVIGRGG